MPDALIATHPACGHVVGWARAQDEEQRVKDEEKWKRRGFDVEIIYDYPGRKLYWCKCHSVEVRRQA